MLRRFLNENKILLLIVQAYQKKKEVPFMETSREKDRKRRESPYMEMPRDNHQKRCYICNDTQLQNQSLVSFTKTNYFFQLPAFYLVHPWLTTQLLPWKSYFVPTIWILPTVKTDLDYFLGPKRFQLLGYKPQSIQER